MAARHNKKVFLSPESVTSSSMIHTKIKDNDRACIRISDCNRTILLWNDIDEPDGKEEMFQKIDTLIRELSGLKLAIEYKTKNQ